MAITIQGGAISAINDIATITNSTFSGNQITATAGSGGGGAIAEQGGMSVTNSTFSDNTATGDGSVQGLGGAIYNQSNGLGVANCTFVGNQAIGNSPDGGAVESANGSPLLSKAAFWRPALPTIAAASATSSTRGTTSPMTQPATSSKVAVAAL